MRYPSVSLSARNLWPPLDCTTPSPCETFYHSLRLSSGVGCQLAFSDFETEKPAWLQHKPHSPASAQAPSVSPGTIAAKHLFGFCKPGFITVESSRSQYTIAVPCSRSTAFAMQQRPPSGVDREQGFFSGCAAFDGCTQPVQENRASEDYCSSGRDRYQILQEVTNQVARTQSLPYALKELASARLEADRGRTAGAFPPRSTS